MPKLECEEVNLEFPNFNFNVSHHGDYVGIASEPICLVGLDIVSHVIFGDETVRGFIENFKSYFSGLEWDNIVNAGSDDEMLNEFYRYWCLKEAFVKALGTGVGYKLDRVEFHHTNWANIYVKVDGEQLNGWRFWLFELGKRHSASVARGHPTTAIESFMKTMKRVHFDTEEYQVGFHLPNPSFLVRTVNDLIPISSRAGSSSK